ncbi:MAG TPA: RNHCP domain-containing protein [Candidatus Paceibacterota bacterium]
MDEPRFQRRIEDFTCEHCRALVLGNGYTNHCPVCLWSKHVDIHPGDRKAACGGLMRPLRLEGASPDYVLVHRCESCAIEKRNMVSSEDSPGALVVLAATRRQET